MKYEMSRPLWVEVRLRHLRRQRSPAGGRCCVQGSRRLLEQRSPAATCFHAPPRRYQPEEDHRSPGPHHEPELPEHRITTGQFGLGGRLEGVQDLGLGGIGRIEDQ